MVVLSESLGIRVWVASPPEHLELETVSAVQSLSSSGTAPEGNVPGLCWDAAGCPDHRVKCVCRAAALVQAINRGFDCKSDLSQAFPQVLVQ